MHETENAALYERAPRPDDDDGGERVGVILDEAALRAVLDDADGPRVVTAIVADDRAALLRGYAVLEVARRWYGPVEVVGGGRVAEDRAVRLRVGPQLHVPARLKGGVEQQ